MNLTPEDIDDYIARDLTPEEVDDLLRQCPDPPDPLEDFEPTSDPSDAGEDIEVEPDDYWIGEDVIVFDPDADDDNESHDTAEEEESAQADSFQTSEDEDDIREISDQEIASSLTRMSDAVIADLVARKLGNCVRFNVDRERFSYFSTETGLWSSTEKEPIVRQVTRDLCQRAAAMINPAEKGSDGQHKWYGDPRRMSGVEAHLKAMPGIAVNQDDFDADPYLLGTPRGVIDLRTGEMLKHSARHLISRSTSVVPADHGDCPKYWSFLLESVGDPETAYFLQRWLGYALSGLTVEQTMLFLFGSGANGKSVLGEIMLRIIGDYAKVMDSSSLMASGVGKHPTDIAALAGARYAMANEIEKGAKLAEARVKGLVGGDKITARYMHCDQFDFQSRIKLVMIGNYLPDFSTSYSMRRRIKIVPFLNRPLTVNPRLLDEIMAEEAGQILRWLINGCVQALRDGVGVAKEVEDYTTEIFGLLDEDDRDDPFEEFLQGIIPEPLAILPFSDAYAYYCEVVRSISQMKEPMSRKKFGSLMIQRFKVARNSSTRYYKDIRLAST